MKGKIPKFGVVGKSESGKTDLICRLIERLEGKDYRVATVKHSRGNFTLDSEGKDTWRHSEAGSELVVFSTPKETDFLFKKSLDLDQIVKQLSSFDGYDILLIEGMKEGDLPKIEVDGENREGAFIQYEDNLEEIVESIEKWVKIYQRLPGLDCGDCGFENCDEMTRAIYEGKKSVEDCVKLGSTEAVVLTVDGEKVPLGNFPAKMLESTIRGMLSSLKGIDQNSDEIEIKIEKEE